LLFIDFISLTHGHTHTHTHTHTHHAKMQVGTRTPYSLSPTLFFLLSCLKGTHVIELSHAKTSLLSVGQLLGSVQVMP